MMLFEVVIPGMTRPPVAVARFTGDADSKMESADEGGTSSPVLHTIGKARSTWITALVDPFVGLLDMV